MAGQTSRNACYTACVANRNEIPVYASALRAFLFIERLRIFLFINAPYCYYYCCYPRSSGSSELEILFINIPSPRQRSINKEQTRSQLIGFGVEVILGDRVFPLVNSFHNIEHTLSITIAAWYVVSDRCVCLRYFNKTHLRITLLLLMVIVSNILLALHHSYLFILW